MNLICRSDAVGENAVLEVRRSRNLCDVRTGTLLDMVSFMMA